MSISITTPIILFPAISLILLAYSEKFFQLARLTRNLKKRYEGSSSAEIMDQIRNLRKRIYLIRNMQAFGTASFFLCVLSIMLLFGGEDSAGQYAFWLSMILLMVALYLSFKEIRISSRALRIDLKELGPAKD